MTHLFNVVLDGMYAYPDKEFKFTSNIDPDEINRVLKDIKYTEKFWEDDLNIHPKHKNWFLSLKDKNPWFASQQAIDLIMETAEDGLCDEHTYMEFTFQVVKAFLPDLTWNGPLPDLTKYVFFGGGQRLEGAV